MEEITYRIDYYGPPYAEHGEPGPPTTNPRKLAEETLRPGQMMIATGPDGHGKVFSWVNGTLMSVQRTDTYITPVKF